MLGSAGVLVWGLLSGEGGTGDVEGGGGVFCESSGGEGVVEDLVQAQFVLLERAELQREMIS